MRKHFTKKRVIVLAIVALAIGITAGALAYFTAGGSGSGTATAGAATGAVTIHATFDNGLVPGTDKAVTFTADNATGTDLRVTTISFGSVSSTVSTCQDVITGAPTQFHMAAVTSNTTVPGGDLDVDLAGTGTLVWDNLPTTDQTACAGAPLTLHVTSN